MSALPKMRRISPIVVLVVLILAFSAETCFAAKQPSGPVKHYVTLMMENRAYDHLLGYFQIPGIHLTGLSGSEYNLWDINDPLSKPIYVSKDAKDVCFVATVNLHHRVHLPCSASRREDPTWPPRH